MKPTWKDLYLAVQGAEVLDEQKSARIAALEAENKKLRIALKPFADIFNGKAIDKKGTYLIPRDAVRNAAEVLKS